MCHNEREGEVYAARNLCGATGVWRRGRFCCCDLGDQIRAKLAPPKLHVEPPDPKGLRITQFIRPEESDERTLQQVQKTIQSRWYFLRVTNEKRFPPAHEVQVVIASLEGEGPDRYPQEIFKIPLPLTWRNQRDLDPRPWRTIGGRSLEADLLFVHEDGLLQFSPVVPLNNFPGTYTKPVVLWATLQALSLEGVSKPLRLKIAWDGKWEEGDTEMANHLRIVPDPTNAPL
jgi:hypothetical protein